MMANERGALAPRGSRRTGERPAARAMKPFHVIDTTDGMGSAVRKVKRHPSAPQAARPALADDVKDAFRELIQQCDAREQAALHERQRAARAVADFENDFRTVIEQIVVPTLEEVASLLGRAGWTCRTVPSSVDADVGVSFEVWRPTMTAVTGSALPHIAFSSIPERLTVGVSAFTRLGGNGRPEYRLEEISIEFVARQTLLFFRQLAADWAAGGF